MSKIVALNAKHDNEDDDNESMDGEELVLTREALVSRSEDNLPQIVLLININIKLIF